MIAPDTPSADEEHDLRARWLLGRADSWRQLFALTWPGGRWRRAARSALTFGVPALLAHLLGFGNNAVFVIMGSLAVMYGEDRPFPSRWRVVLGAGVVLLVTAAFGAVLGYPFVGRSAGALEIAALIGVAVVLAFIGGAIDLAPPGSFFWFLVCDISFQTVKNGGSPGAVLGWMTLGIISSLAVTLLSACFDSDRPVRNAVDAADYAVKRYVGLRAGGPSAVLARRDASHALYSAWATIYDARLHRRPGAEKVTELAAIGRSFRSAHRGAVPDLEGAFTLPLARPTVWYRLRHAMSLNSHEMAMAARLFLAGAVAGGVCVALGASHADWALMAAVLVLWQGPVPILGTVRAVHRLVGTVLGIGVFASLAAVGPGPIAVTLVLVAALFLIDFFIVSNYAVAVMFITPLALLIGGAGHAISLGAVIGGRILENLTGVIVAVAVLWCVDRHAHRRRMLWARRRVIAAASALLSVLATTSPNQPTALRLRRDLYYELLGAARSGSAAANVEPSWAIDNWDYDVRIERLGYMLQAACAAVPPGGFLADIDAWLAGFADPQSEDRHELSSDESSEPTMH